YGIWVFEPFVQTTQKELFHWLSILDENRSGQPLSRFSRDSASITVVHASLREAFANVDYTDWLRVENTISENVILGAVNKLPLR
ncbi:MAG TPA: hypothetical protein VK206_28780, partial [Anaerolineales bacterium]|nr:hypothetical protein [Anaerolineales bacterium]